ITYGLIRLNEEEFRPGPRIALLQGNVDQRLRNRAAGNSKDREDIAVHYGLLCKDARRQDPQPELLIWPETSFPEEWFEWRTPRVPDTWVSGRRSYENRRNVFIQLYPTHHLIGLNSHLLDEHGRAHRYNTALLLNQSGNIEGTHYKLHPLPFGEYL